MADSERPLLLLPQRGRAPRTKRTPAFPPMHTPSRDRQAQRIAPRLTALAREVEEQRARLQTTALGAYPEDVLVFDVVGSISSFRSAIERTEHLSWLAEQLGPDVDSSEDFHFGDSRKQLSTRLYFVASTAGGVRELLSLWSHYQAGRPFDRGHGAWKTLFNRLSDLRRWGRRERIEETGVLDAWESELREGATDVQAEIELWFRGSVERRRESERSVLAALAELGGEVLDGPAIVEEAHLHLILARLPADAVPRLRNDANVALAECADVQGVRVPAQAVAVVPGEVAEGEPVDAGLPTGAPVVAVLDGVVMENHPALAGRLVVDDPEGWAHETEVRHRKHGTAVVSVALWGDLRRPEEPPQRPLYVRPILQHHDDSEVECTPSGRLAVDVVHAAVARMFEGDDPVAPEVAVINLSIGDQTRPFDGLTLSPLARLLDALSWRYKVLFVVSAGNEKIVEVVDGNWIELENDPIKRHAGCLRSLRERLHARALLSPAEGINALVVGALDHDEGPDLVGQHVAPFEGAVAPAWYSRFGPGYRHSVKPDLLAPGGRGPVSFLPHLGVTRAQGAEPSRSSPFGVRVASPPERGEAHPVTHVQGTSFAAPAITRAAAVVSDGLDDWINREGDDLFQRAPRAVWLKALLVHAASRSAFVEFVQPVVEGADTRARGRDERKLLDRLVGFGPVELDRVLSCETTRVTVMGGGTLGEDDAHTYEFPLPESLLQVGRTFRRSLRVTLAWLAPPWPGSSLYRGAALSLDPVEKVRGLVLGKYEADHHAVGRGTVIHNVWQTHRGRAAFEQGDAIALKVNCRADALPRLDEPIPYALVVTFEVEAGLDVDIWQDVRNRIRPRVRVGSRR